ncbi:hypothetical protein [Parasutterella excrementihominis]|uniref:hypothetical protein n=1 Tax=Parasutterella excrementihominis TaxID=487175 RepID=UPI0012BB58A2|nr:hypothetical protein [Parasutterella excrementihominis]MTU25117.1 hypothetical protein [Parasutterella excrementihominis]
MEMRFGRLKAAKIAKLSQKSFRLIQNLANYSLVYPREVKIMVNLELTESELVFLQRLIGHNMTDKSLPDGLYDKIADKTDKLGITNNSPLNLVDVSK